MQNKQLSKTAVFFVLAVVLGFMGFSKPMTAQSIEPVTVQSAKNFDGTVAALKKAVSGGGMMVLSELDQGNILSMTGISIKVQTFFIGNPNIGKDAFSEDLSVGVAIPVRVNVYEDAGKTYISYYKPSELLEFSTSKKVKMIGNKMDEKLHSMTSMLSK